jgi:hemolysin activation/secretion protein
VFEKKGVTDYSFYTILFPQKSYLYQKPRVRLYERNNYKQIVVDTDSTVIKIYLNPDKNIKLEELESDASIIVTVESDNVTKNYLLIDGSYLNTKNFTAKASKNDSFEIIGLTDKTFEINGNSENIELHVN